MTKQMKEEMVADIARSLGVPATLGGDVWYRGRHGIIVGAKNINLIIVFDPAHLSYPSHMHPTLSGISFTDPNEVKPELKISETIKNLEKIRSMMKEEQMEAFHRIMISLDPSYKPKL